MKTTREKPGFVRGGRLTPLKGPAVESTGEEEIGALPQERFGALVGGSSVMRRLFYLLGLVAPTNLTVLLTGETGTGKDRVAQALHEHSGRASKPFVVVDCTTIHHNLAESELFGHEKAAFTGASRRTDGYFHQADGGTIFLDEIGDLSLDLQPKLLRALAERKVHRVGGRGYEKVDVRVIAATRQSLDDSVSARRFRPDLFFRLNQCVFDMPPLRERRDDIPAIVRAECARLGSPERAEQIIAYLDDRRRHYAWPGNVRELVGKIEYATQVPPERWDEMLRWNDTSEPSGSATHFGKARRELLEAFEKRYFTQLFEITKGNVSEMSRRSAVARHHVRAYLRKLGLHSNGER